LDVAEAVRGRRSVRHFSPCPVPRETIEELVQAACLAPAPHHSRPWQFVLLSQKVRTALVQAMEEAWQRDLAADGVPPAQAEALLRRSRQRILFSPALILCCLDMAQARPWPDPRRQRAERDMFVQSLGAAIQNLQLLAHAKGLGTCIMAAPAFCQEDVKRALALPQDWEPLFLLQLGYPHPSHRPPPRPPSPLDAIFKEL